LSASPGGQPAAAERLEAPGLIVGQPDEAGYQMLLTAGLT